MKFGTMLAGTARRVPDKVAAICGGRRLTFAALDRNSNRIANALINEGLRPGDRLAAYVGNHVGLIELFAAALKAGAVLVPVNPRLTPREFAFIVGDCRPFAVVTGPEQEGALAGAEAACPGLRRYAIDAAAGAPSLDTLREAGADSPPPALAPGTTPALIGYTSGTTGTPKGAVITHANMILNHLMSVQQFGLGREDVWIAATPLAHRTGLARLQTAFGLGSTVVVLPRFDIPALVEAVEAHGITGITGVPTVVRLLLDHIEGTDIALTSLRKIITGGEAFPPPLKARLAARLPQVALHHFYGSTEGGIMASAGPADHVAKPESTGLPWPGVELRIVDAELREVPGGEPGEILVRGGVPGQMWTVAGYFNRPEADREAFVDGWFRTGDVGRFDADGHLHVVDRVKDMILSGGYNIYSKEVEHAILAHADVADAAVCAAPDAEFGEAVAAFVVARPGRSPTAADIVAHCRREIASYKKPKYVFFVDSLPYNSIGKVTKGELRARAKAHVAAAVAEAAAP